MCRRCTKWCIRRELGAVSSGQQIVRNLHNIVLHQSDEPSKIGRDRSEWLQEHQAHCCGEHSAGIPSSPCGLNSYQLAIGANSWLWLQWTRTTRSVSPSHHNSAAHNRFLWVLVVSFRVRLTRSMHGMYAHLPYCNYSIAQVSAPGRQCRATGEAFIPNQRRRPQLGDNKGLHQQDDRQLVTPAAPQTLQPLSIIGNSFKFCKQSTMENQQAMHK